jgi:hypothetical protein
MKAILTFATLLFIATSAVSSAVLYLNGAFLFSAAMHVIAFLSLSLWINSAAVSGLNTEKA